MTYIDTKCPHCGKSVQVDTEGMRPHEIASSFVIFEAFYVRCDWCNCLFDCKLRYDRLYSMDEASILEEGKE